MRRSVARLGYAFSWHGIAGFLGYALAPAFGIGLATAFGWQGALLAAARWGRDRAGCSRPEREPLRRARRREARSSRAGLAEDLRLLSSTRC
jgi:MFS family permease